jgi:hypothetical protein
MEVRLPGGDQSPGSHRQVRALVRPVSKGDGVVARREHLAPLVDVVAAQVCHLRSDLPVSHFGHDLPTGEVGVRQEPVRVAQAVPVYQAPVEAAESAELPRKLKIPQVVDHRYDRNPERQ